MLFFVVVLIKNKNNGEIKMENLIGKKVKLTKELQLNITMINLM